MLRIVVIATARAAAIPRTTRRDPQLAKIHCRRIHHDRLGVQFVASQYC